MTTKIGPMSFYFFLTSKLIIFSQPIKSENSIAETIKICLGKFQDLFVESEDDENYDLDVFTILKTLISVFREECEIYISKYKIVPLMIQFINLEVDDVRIHFVIYFKGKRF
jgi:hypothetical protein